MEVALTMPSATNILERLRWKVGLGLVIVAAGFAAQAAPSAGPANEVARSSWGVAADADADVARSSWGIAADADTDVARSSWGVAAEDTDVAATSGGATTLRSSWG
jgi:hypothetical protein